MRRHSARGGRRARAGLHVSFAALAAIGLGTAAAVAATAGAAPLHSAETAPATTPAASSDANAVHLSLEGQDAWTAVGGTLTMRVQITPISAVSAGSTLVVSAHQTVTRTNFQRTLDGGEALGQPLDQVTVPLGGIPADVAGDRTVTIGIQDPNQPRDPSRLLLRRTTGVYPLDVELRDDDNRPVDHFVTFAVVVAPGTNGRPAIASELQVAWVWPLAAPPALRLDGTPDPRVVSQLRPGGRLGRQVVALRQASDVPVTLVPSPETLESWATLGERDPALQGGVEALRALRPDDQVLAGPYVPIDMGSLLDHNLGGAVDAELSRGDEALKAFFGTRADTTTALARPLRGSTLARLRNGNVTRVIVDSSALAPARASQFTPALPFELPVLFASSVEGVASDDGLGRLLTGDASPALRAQRFLAGLSVVALEQPAVPRAVVVVNPDGFDAPAELLHSALQGLRENPLLEPVTVGAAFDSHPLPTTSTTPPRQLAPETPSAEPSITGVGYFRAEVRLAAFQQLVGNQDPRVDRGDRALLVAVSSEWKGTNGRERARTELGVIDSAVDAFLAGIHLPNPSTITLTSRSGEVPLTFRNDTGRPVRVRVSLASDKLFFPQGAVHDVELAPRSTTVRVAVQARTSGTFPLRVTVTSTDGGLAISDTRFQIRSTVVSAVGVALMAGAGVFLAAWWIFDIRRRRRRAAAAPTQ